MAHITPNGRVGIARTTTLVFLILIFSSCIFGQQPTCTVAASSPVVHAEGLAEQVGDITITCAGGTYPVVTQLVVALNANITNRLDINGNLTKVTIGGTANNQGVLPTLNSPKVLTFNSVQLTSAGPFTITGIRAAIPTASGGSSSPQQVTGSVIGGQLNLPSTTLVLGQTEPTLLSSVLNYGVPCMGSPATTPLSPTPDFPGLLAVGTNASTVRITEAFGGIFTAKTLSSDSGVRFLVSLSGYGPNAQIFVPDVIVGKSGTTPTSAGAYNIPANGGTYTPGLNQLLLTRVNLADSTGANGTLSLPTLPLAATNFTTVTQVPLVNGAATVTYEVLGANPTTFDSAQIPVFVVVPSTDCTKTPEENTLGATLAPASTVSIATQTDPIPRFIANTPPSDCSIMNDCTAPYFPSLIVSATPITLNGSSLGQTQSAFIAVQNGGTSQLTFNVSTAYVPSANQSAANWLSLYSTTGVVDPSQGINTSGTTIFANPAGLQPGTYQATVTINAGVAGTATVPVTFNVGLAGPVIQSVVNAANSQPGPIAPGSIATIYGLNLVAKQTAIVTIFGYPATVLYDGQPSTSSPSQINVIVPTAITATNAAVVARIDGVDTSPFTISLVPNAPAVFNPGILNQNNSVNSAGSPASRGDIIQVFLTGLATPVTLPVTVTIGGQSITGGQITYAGAVPSIPGLDQVNVQVPAALTFTGNSAPLSICLPGAGGQAVCSAQVPLYLH